MNNSKTDQNKADYQRLFERANVGILKISSDFIIVECNEKLLQLLGRPRNEIIGLTPVDPSISPKIQPNGISSFEFGQAKFSDATEGSDQCFEWVHLKKDGTEFLVEVSIFGFSASEKSYFAIWKDLTEIKKNESILKEAQQIAKVGHWYLDNVNENLECSDEIYRILNLKPQEFEASYNILIKYVHPDDKERVIQAFTFSLRMKTPLDIHHRLKLKNNIIKHVHVRCLTRYDENDIPISSNGTVQDVTKQIKYQNALEASEFKFKTFTEFLKISIVVVQDEKIRYINKECESLFKGPKEKLIGESFINFIHPDSLDTILKNYESRMKGDRASHRYEIKLHSEYGDIIEVDFNSVIIEYEGRPAILASFLDITEQKRTEKELLLSKKTIEVSERKFRELYEKSGDAILIIENETFVNCNKATIDMLGYRSKEEFLNTHPSKLSPKTQPDGLGSFEKAEKMMETALENGTHRFEWAHTRSNGENFPVEVLLTAISNEPDNKVIHCVWRDITERVKIENKIKGLNKDLEKRVKERTNELRENQARLNYLISSSPVAIYTSKAEDDYGITFISENAEQLFGYKPSLFTGDSSFWVNHVHPDDKQRFFKEIPILFEKGFLGIDYRIKRCDGNYMWIHDELLLMYHDDGTVNEIIGYWANIEARKKAETEIINKTEELETFNKIMVDRELRIIEMKEKINTLCKQLDKAPPYPEIWKD